MFEAGADRDLMPEVSGKLHHHDAAILRFQAAQYFGAAIGAAIINKDDLVIQSLFGQSLGNAGMQRGKIFFLVEDRNDDRQHRRRQGLAPWPQDRGDQRRLLAMALGA